ncbi:MAG: hypothetical protein QF886_00670, partial [Planctomycetota bacterium]|nr:hypothetical protein [Planctomycetota bacterium]
MQRRTLCTGLMLVGAIALNVLDAEQRQQAPKSTFWWLSGAEQTKDRLLVEAWWIWKSKDVWGDPEVGGTFIFSKEFVLEDAVREAEIRISAQNSYELTINGRKAGADDQVLTLEQYDISGFLKKGTNRLTVRAESKSWRAGLFVCASARLKNGQTSEVVSDGTWRFTREGETNSSFAAEVARGVDGGIWNNVGRLMVMPGAWHKLNSSVSCPGINWARPFAGRKLKIVAFQSRAKQRDTVELLHRTEMKVKAVFPEVSPRNYEYSSAPFFPATKGLFLEDALKELRGALDSAPDVILWGGFGRYFHTREEFFYEHVAELLRAFVSNGGGLIYVRGAIPPRTTPTGRKDKRGREILDRDYSFEKELTAKSVDGTNPFLSMGTPFGRLPGFYGSEGYDKVAELFQCGKGRVVRLLGVGSHYGQFADRAKDYSDLHYQYYLSFTIKTILWSGNEIPVISFSRFPNSVSVTRDAPEPSFRFTLDNVPVGCKAVVSVRSPLKHFNLPEQPVVSQGVERGAGILKPVYERTVNVPKGDVARVAVALPALPEGDYFVDVIIKQDGKTANWAVAALSIEDDLRISDVRLSKEYVDVADGKSDEIEAEAVLSTAAPNGSQVRFFLLDNYDRVISRREVTLGVGVRGRTKFPIPHFSTTLGRVRAELVVNGRFADVQTARFTAVRRDWDRFTLFGWTGRISGHQGNVYLRVLAGLGLDATEYASIDMDWLEAADRVALPAYPFPRLSRAIGDLDRLRDAYREKAAKTVENQMRYDPIAFTHGNEFFYGGGDEEGARVRDYQDFLKGRYKTIGRLNQQWGADYRFFEDVYPLSRRKPDELAKLRGNFVSQGDYLERADETRNYSRFVDQWLNNYRIYFELGKISVDSIKKHYPAARLGFDCPMWPHAFSGHDWHKVMNEFNFFAPYGRGGEIIPLKEARSYLKPGQ